MLQLMIVFCLFQVFLPLIRRRDSGWLWVSPTFPPPDIRGFPTHTAGRCTDNLFSASVYHMHPLKMLVKWPRVYFTFLSFKVKLQLSKFKIKCKEYIIKHYLVALYLAASDMSKAWRQVSKTFKKYLFFKISFCYICYS